MNLEIKNNLKIKKKGYTSFFIMLVLTTLLVSVVLIYSYSAGSSTIKSNNKYAIDYNNKILVLKSSLLNEINIKLSSIDSSYSLTKFITNLNDNLSEFKTKNKCDFQVVSLSNTVYRINMSSNLDTNYKFDMKFSFYIEFYAEEDLYLCRVRGVIL